MQALIPVIARCASLTHLDLSSNRLQADALTTKAAPSAWEIHSAWGTAPSIGAQEHRGNRGNQPSAGAAGAAGATPALLSPRSQQWQSLPPIRQLVTALKLGHIQTLVLRNNPLGKAVSTLALALGSKKRRANVCGGGEGASGGEEEEGGKERGGKGGAEGDSTLFSLTSLDLRNTGTSNSGARALGRALANNSTLISLNLHSVNTTNAWMYTNFKLDSSDHF